jgi:hypothetical protein
MSIATPAMNEHERWFAFALHCIVNGNTIRSRHYRGFLRLRQRDRKRQKENEIQEHFSHLNFAIVGQL